MGGLGMMQGVREVGVGAEEGVQELEVVQRGGIPQGGGVGSEDRGAGLAQTHGADPSFTPPGCHSFLLLVSSFILCKHFNIILMIKIIKNSDIELYIN